MSAKQMLGEVKVASPCAARWGHMVGDERVRFCNQCQKHVYNLSAMTSDEAASLVLQKEGKLCARFYRRPDGTMLTSDCPHGAGRFWRRIKTRLLASAALVAVASGTALAVNSNQSRMNAAPRSGRVVQLWQDAKMKVQTWFGLNSRTPVMMGEICVAPPKTAPPSSSN